ncbi:alpha/beta hydrolase [Pelagicoccus sp. SDUM812005]|uniref:alpha/beta hydrolase n=1 Tax=Pelagicoccus sp. SDUM812005 TaxID=3041257 RepID=UPI00280F3C87|nr:alpha/beta hydrolase [Pelagicoccus sp. SDUM812005]MDQ8183782.1 alpha/beta hydrolase [Pelagicoccus sp. SDUM812005]
MKLAFIIFIFYSLLPFTCRAQVPSDLPNVAYGSDIKQQMDVWLAQSDEPTPVVVYIHGGGWVGGTKKLKPKDRWSNLQTLILEKGISFISIDYRLNKDGNKLPTPINDAARAIQFIRHNATSWNIDKKRIAVMGGSAGGCISLWLLLHDDLAEPESEDLVSRESTRVLGAISQNGQTNIDPKWIEKTIGIEGAKHQMIWRAVGADSLAEALEGYDQWQSLYHKYSPINHLDQNDPPYLGIYRKDQPIPAETVGEGIHHGLFGAKLKEKSDAIGHIGYLTHSSDNPYENEIDFLVTILGNERDQ